MEQDKKLFLLDAYALIFRAYYALINSPRLTSTGINTSAAFGFLNTLLEVLNKENPSHIAVCFDPAGPTFRHEAYEKYKAEREATPEDIKKAIPYIKEILRGFRIPVVEVPGFEADDVIGTIAHKAKSAGFTTYMMTPDKDFGQLVTDGVYIFRPGWRGGDFEVRGVKEICEKYEIDSPLQVIDILALMGDKVDNIPGCPGVGDKTAIKLVKQFHSVENLLENTSELKGAIKTKVEANAEQIRFSKFLATIVTDAPVDFNEEDFKRKDIDADVLRAVLEKLEFRTFIKRILGKENLGDANNATPVVASGGLFAEAKPNAQGSLFGNLDESEDGSIATVMPTAVPTEYTMVSNNENVQEALLAMANCSEVAMHILTTDNATMRSQIIGIALSCEAHKSIYIPVPANGSERDTIFNGISNIFSSGRTMLVSGDVKRDIILLHNIGITVGDNYFDTAVAHYLIQPETNHTLEYLSEVLLHHPTIPLASLTGPKGRNFKPLHTLPASALTDYACELADYALQLKPLLLKQVDDNGMDKLFYDIELPLIKVLAEIEITGVRVDVKSLNEYSRLLTDQMNRIEAECFELAGEQFNISSPAQVGEILFGKLQLDPKAKKTRKGQYSTTEEILVKLKDKHPLVGKILELRGVRKLLTTYVNALPELINPTTGRIHTTYNQTVTATGRLSSTNPNMQNIPVRNDEGREIRKAFIPADGNVFFSADYSQIELRLVADFSHDKTMVDAFTHNDDIHSITASKIYHEKLESVTADQRRKAKTANFGILYGISAFGLSERLEIPRSEAKMLIDGYFATFPEVKEYIDASIAKAHELGYVTTKFGRRRMLPDINSRNAVVRNFSERNAVNAPIQGTAADIIKIAMVRIFRRFKEEGIKSKMIMQVHDELNFDVIPSELDKVSKIVKEEMEGAYNGSVPLTASTGAAENWLLAH